VQDPAERKASVAALYDTIASRYDRVGPPFYARNGAALVAKVGPRPGERVLDAGCGRGACLLPAAVTVGPAGEVIGVDGSARMVEEAAAEAQRRGLTNVTVRQGDAEAPEFPDGSFDAVLSGFVLRLLLDPAAALRAYRRLLRPAGRFGASLYASSFSARWRPVQAALEPYLGGGATAGTDPFATTQSFADLVRDAGFDAVLVIDEPSDVAFPDVDRWWEYLWSSGYRGSMERIPPARRDAARDAACAAAAALCEPDGSLVMDLMVRFATGVRR
jgi:ubiquinone/menaquinone biosynthesis C-methylase UbiE